MKGDIGFPEPDSRDLHRALSAEPLDHSGSPGIARGFATEGAHLFVGDDDHAPPWIDRGGRDTRAHRIFPDPTTGAMRPAWQTGPLDTPANPKDVQALRDGKVPLDLIEHAAEVEIAKAMHTGAMKYGRRNYCHPDTPIYATTYGAAVRRHMGAWLAGEDLDPDSGLSHWAHIGANVNVVLGAMAAGTFIDDRAPATPLPASSRSNAQHSGSVGPGTPIRSGD